MRNELKDVQPILKQVKAVIDDIFSSLCPWLLFVRLSAWTISVTVTVCNTGHLSDLKYAAQVWMRLFFKPDGAEREIWNVGSDVVLGAWTNIALIWIGSEYCYSV